MDQMPDEKKVREDLGKRLDGGPSRWPWLVAVLVLAAAGVAGYLIWGSRPPATEPTATPKQAAAQKASESKTEPGAKAGVPAPPAPSAGGEVVRVSPGHTSAAEAAEQAKRKKPYGLKKSLDVVVRSDESVMVGGKKVPMREMERKLVVEQRGELLDRPLDKSKRVSAWGVHLVRPGENLWDIHYHLLREYLASRGKQLPLNADQPTPQGYSSGVGKVLKFAEHMVGVYNIKTGKMSSNLNLLEPGQKMVVFNLSEIFQQLAKINPDDLSGVMYDGRLLLFPQSKGKATSVMAPAVSAPKDKE